MNKFQKFLESIESSNPELVQGIAKAYELLTESRQGVTEDLGSTLSGIGELEQGDASEESASADELVAEKMRSGAPYTNVSSIAEGLTSAGNSCMTKMKNLVDKHGYWSEPVKQYSTEMENDSNLTPDDRAMVHSTHMNMY